MFKLEGCEDEDCYLYVGHGFHWSFWSSLEKDQMFIASGSAGQACPAHPRNAFNDAEGSRDWRFNKSEGNRVEGLLVPGADVGVGGVVIRCAVHGH